MTTYWFQVNDGRRTDLIEEDLPDVTAVRKMGILLLGALLHEHAYEYCESRMWKLSVRARDGSGVEVFQLNAEGADPRHGSQA